jgi:hypothetical protein
VAGSNAPTVTAPSAARVMGRLGWLRKKGTRRVRMAKMISVWVASDSTNQPVRNSTGPACSTRSRIANVRKSKIELSGPKVSMNRRMNPMSQCEGRRNCSVSTLSVGMADTCAGTGGEPHQQVQTLPAAVAPQGAAVLCGHLGLAHPTQAGQHHRATGPGRSGVGPGPRLPPLATGGSNPTSTGRDTAVRLWTVTGPWNTPAGP